jgi:probable F420-dependent oxidoreductase
MRFSYAEAMTDPAHYVPLAKAAEAAGFDSFLVPDSIAYPEHSDSRYPFNPDGSREFLEDKPFIDPFVLIAALATATERLRFTTSVVKLPIRHPVLVAKQVASAAVLSGDRLDLGVGISPWPDDFAITGTPWSGRGRRMDECIEILRGLLHGGYHEHHSDLYDVPPIKISPVPDRPVPILIGGHSDAALRRAARLDGWIHGGGDPADLPELLDRLRRHREEQGTADDPFQVHVISMDAYVVDGVARLEDQGVTDVIVGFRWPYSTGPDLQPLGEKVELLQRYADDVIDPYRRRDAGSRGDRSD